jgi:hypothetical protein
MESAGLIAHSIVDKYAIVTQYFPQGWDGESTQDLFETTIYATERETNGKLLNGMRIVTPNMLVAHFNHKDFVAIASHPGNVKEKK